MKERLKLLLVVLLLCSASILSAQDCIGCEDVDKQTNLRVEYRETLRYSPKGVLPEEVYKIQVGIFEIKPEIMPPNCIAIKHNLTANKHVWYVWYDSWYYEYNDAKFIAATIAKQYACGAFVIKSLKTLE